MKYYYVATDGEEIIALFETNHPAGYVEMLGFYNLKPIKKSEFETYLAFGVSNVYHTRYENGRVVKQVHRSIDLVNDAVGSE